MKRYSVIQRILNEDLNQIKPLLEYKPALLNFIFYNRRHLKEQLITKHQINSYVINELFQQQPVELTESLLSILDPKIIHNVIQEGFFKCSIEDIEKRVKKIIFGKYNWDPKSVIFNTEDNAIQIINVIDFKPELQQITNDNIIFTYLKTLSKNYTKDLNNEFIGFCDKLSFLPSLTTHITSSVYCYTIIKKNEQFFFFSSNGEKKRLKNINHPQYQLNKLYFKIGLFTSNLTNEGLNLIKKNTSPAEQWFTDLFNKMEQIPDMDYPNDIDFNIKHKNYLNYEQENNILWVNFDGVWSTLRNQFNLNEQQIKELITKVIEDNTKLRGFKIKRPIHYTEFLTNEGLNLIKKNTSLAEQWFTDLFNKMEQIPDINNPGNIWFEINNEKYLHYEQQNNELLVDYYAIWSILKSKFNLNYQQIKDLITKVVEDNTNLKGFTTYNFKGFEL